MILDGKSLQEYPGNAGVHQGSILDPTLFLQYISFLLYLPDDFICNIAIYVDETILYFKCDQASALWQQLELAAEFEPDLQDSMGWEKKWLVDCNAGKTQLLLFDWGNNIGAVDVKMEMSVHLFLHLLSLFNPFCLDSHLLHSRNGIHVYMNWHNCFHFLILGGGVPIILKDYMIFLSPFLYALRMYMSIFFSLQS